MLPRLLSDKELHTHLKSLVERERRVTLDVIAHLNEVERRRLHARLGYGSLFDYCTRGLGYSESAANRRIRAARCTRRSPVMQKALASGRVTVSTVSQVAGIVTPMNDKQLVADIAGRSQREVEQVVARHRPELRPRERVRPVCVPTLKCQQSYRRSGGKKLTTGDDAELQELFELKFAVSPEVMQKLERVKVILSTKYPNGVSLEAVLEAGLDVYIDKHDPAARERRRVKRAAREAKPMIEQIDRKRADDKAPSPTSSESTIQRDVAAERTRHIPPAVRDAVLVRDASRCTYVAPDGRRCRSTHNLQIDHITPFARGGPNAISNLRVLCAQHNRLESERVFGQRFIRRE